MDWETFIIAILGSGAVTALVNVWMNHRTQIRAIKESGLYSKRAEVLDEIMKRMEELHRIMGELVSFFQDDGSADAEKARRKKTAEAFNCFLEYLKRNRHYLPRKLSEEIQHLCDEYKELFMSFSFEARPEEGRSDLKKWKSLIDRYDMDFTDQQECIADEFRKIIGVK
ncbi:MAG: hypothetical protein WCT49_00755 [Candidatus Paceibacterota bacterium]|jgi:hypothetical protein|nr:hypothetical protein [Candidatus Paceibacterota bacterium]